MSLQLDALRVSKQYSRDAWLEEASSADVAPVASQRSISVFGLGYVGAVSLACLARDGHEVYGVDIDQTKLDLVRDGHSPIIEEGMQELMRAVVNGGGVTVTERNHAFVVEFLARRSVKLRKLKLDIISL